ncbi:hypothetical protein OG2516_03428 [Oceanicola granulosus HTCC2516]|uniref:Uncharacterized protein n=1 Tax=Oceanicola granulosus (strain ATCC BAA-861 / DSM 15982 / KCTC 12143 / HTCC2516) TaxID=314256 RepID=Q2C9R5_OCEGH|nr:hypothetical protein [Oceanicola granulosus]EAR49417.1 hypothetical protein OG2516_03428 [Oceanicola granulosus HTCC2516]
MLRPLALLLSLAPLAAAAQDLREVCTARLDCPAESDGVCAETDFSFTLVTPDLFSHRILVGIGKTWVQPVAAPTDDVFVWDDPWYSWSLSYVFNPNSDSAEHPDFLLTRAEVGGPPSRTRAFVGTCEVVE